MIAMCITFIRKNLLNIYSYKSTCTHLNLAEKQQSILLIQSQKSLIKQNHLQDNIFNIDCRTLPRATALEFNMGWEQGFSF